MTVFSDGTKERLHGHNFQVTLELEVQNTSFLEFIDFGVIKKGISELCESWDEKLLLAALNPHFKSLGRSPGETEFTLCGSRYVLPELEVVLLPIDNVTVENLAAELGRLLEVRLLSTLSNPNVLGFAVQVSESPGQSATWRWVRL